MKMLSYDPAKRPTIQEIREHPWMRKLDHNKAEKEIVSKLRSNDSYTLNINMKSTTPKSKTLSNYNSFEKNTRSQRRLNTAT